MLRVIKKLNALRVGSIVKVECFTSMGTGSKEKVTKITKEFDEKSGKPYRVIWCGRRSFDGRDGNAISQPTMYYIDV